MSNFHELPMMEQLAIKQALFSMLGDDVSTKNPDSLRHAMDEQVVANYGTMGAKSYDVPVNGQKVGTYSVRVGKEVPAKTTRRIVVRDPHKLEKFIEDNIVQCVQADEMPYAEMYAQAMMQNFAEYVLENFGEVCDGCEVVKHTTPAQPARVLGTTLRIDSQKVADALQGYLPTTIAGLLGGGDDE